MRAVVIVIMLPCPDLLAGIGQRREQRLVKEFVAKAPVETLHGSAWLARRYVVPLDLPPLFVAS